MHHRFTGPRCGRHAFVTCCLCAMLMLVVGTGTGRAQDNQARGVRAAMAFTPPTDVTLGGILGTAVAQSRKGRLAKLPGWNDGALIKMFGSEVKNSHHKTDWYGEHGGKWLYAAASAAVKDPALKERLLQTADYLVANQEADGYLGTYSPKIRLTNTDARHTRSWDAWNLSYMALGLLEVNRYFPKPEYLKAAKKIGDLFFETFGPGKHDITEYGTRHGISATIILDPVVELYKVSDDDRYRALAETVICNMEKQPDARIVSVSLNGGDLETVGDGKAYQLLWNLTAIAKLYEVTGNPDYLKAVTNAWDNVVTHHLTVAGGPWGGVGKHLECFNKRYFWNPYGFIETCSTMSWIQLNKVLLRLTGEAKYAEEIERAAYNALLGAQYPNGVDWAYHSFSNGRRHIAHFDDCCPSSGALALQELPDLVYATKGNGMACNLLTASDAVVTLASGNRVRVVQETKYPFEGSIRLTLSPSKKETFPLYIRIPAWVSSAQVRINDAVADISDLKPGAYFNIERAWRKGDRVEITLPMELKVHRKTERAAAPQGGPDLFRVNWFALTRGPLVFAADGLIDNNRECVVPLSDKHPEKDFSAVAAPEGYEGPAYALDRAEGKRVLFVPYYEAGGRVVNTWRLTWLQSGIH